MLTAGRPPFRADHIGSLLRPQALRQAFRRHASGEINDSVFGQLQDKYIREVVALQQEVGLQVVTDGEFRRGSYWGRFVKLTEGFEIKPATFKFRNDEGHEVDFTAPYVKGKIRRTQPLALDEFLFLKGVASATPKITLPAPSTMHFFVATTLPMAGSIRTPRAASPTSQKYFSRRSTTWPWPAAGTCSLTK